MNTKRIIYLLIGPILLIVSSLGLTGVFGTAGAQAIGVSLWMIFWWITRPVHITITALLPALVNAFLNMVPMTDVISQYSCESIVLVFASGLIIMPWASHRPGSSYRTEGAVRCRPLHEVSDHRLALCNHHLLHRSA